MIDLKKLLGRDYEEALAKAEIYKPHSKVVLDQHEMRIALQIVPRVVMKFLVKELKPMEIGEGKDVILPMLGGCENKIHVTKYESDVYSGDIIQDNKILTSFKDRSIPGLALIIMSTFEMYDNDDLEASAISPADDEKFQQKCTGLQTFIDDRMQMQGLVEQVVTKKMAEKDAIEMLVAKRLGEVVHAPVMPKPFVPPPPIAITEPLPADLVLDVTKKETMKVCKLKDFLERRSQKNAGLEVRITKSEINCPDCGHTLFSKQGFSGCVCLGTDANNAITLVKTEKGVTLHFAKSWETENIELLLEAVQKANRG